MSSSTTLKSLPSSVDSFNVNNTSNFFPPGILKPCVLLKRKRELQAERVTHKVKKHENLDEKLKYSGQQGAAAAAHYVVVL